MIARLARWSLVLAAVGVLAPTTSVSNWVRHDIHRHEGRIDADLMYETRPSAAYPGSYRRIRLVVRRDGKVRVTECCYELKEYRREAADNAYRTTAHPNRAYDALGMISPWCADEYRLGNERASTRGLARSRANGYLDGYHVGIWDQNAHTAGSVIRVLEKRLVAWGYANSSD